MNGQKQPGVSSTSDKKGKDKARLFAVSDLDATEAQKHKAARAQESALLDEHRKKQIDKRLEEKASKEEKGRQFFDPAKDMASSGMSVNAVKRTIDSAAGLHDRFSSGKS